MDFTPELSAFQGALISADNIHPFSSLTARGGNEEKILYVTNSIRNLTEREDMNSDKSLPPDSAERLRKFSLYLVLNADFPVLEEMVEFEGIDLVIWTIPTIPKCLLCELFWNLKLDMCVYEIIAFCAPKLSLQVADAFINSIKYCSPQSSLQKVKIICSAIYNQMCRLHLLVLDRLELLNILITCFNNFTKCLNYFLNPPNSGKLECLHKDEKYKHVGKCLFTLFQLIQECFSYYSEKVARHPLNYAEIYELTQKKDNLVHSDLEFTVNNSPNTSILEYIDKCNTVLLDKCELLVREISVDIYCAWSEFEENGKSMQQSIGELCFHMRSKLLSINILSEHPVVSMIQEISRQPKQIADLINDADCDTIMKYVEESGNDRIKWLQALLNRSSTLENITLLNQIIINIDVLDDSDCYSLLSRLYEHYKSTLEMKDDIKIIIIKLFTKCTLESKYEIIKGHFVDKRFLNNLETSEFSDSLTKIFNKLVSVPEADFIDVLSLFIQNPQQTYSKIFDVAIENVHQKNLMLQVIKLLDDFKNYFYDCDMESCIVKVTKDKLDTAADTEAKLNNLLLFITELKNMNTIPATKLLLLIIMPKLHKALIDRNIQVVYNQCRLLQDCFNTQDLVSYRAPLLAMLAQVLDAVRWRIDTFTTKMPVILQLVVSLHKSLFDTYCDNIPEKEIIWLKSKVKNTEPLNMYYYRKLWNPPGENFVEIITGRPVHNKMDVEQLVAWLSQILSSTTEQEWYEIWDSLKCFGTNTSLDIFHDALCLITMAQSVNHTDKSWACLLHCYRNFVFIVRILSSTTEQEWYEIWDSLKCFGTNTSLDIFHDALCLITMAQSVNHTDKSWACLLHCYRNFVFIVRHKFFKEPLTDEQLSAVLHKFKTIENILKEENIEELNSVLLPLFAYMAERKGDFAKNIPIFFNDTQMFKCNQ